MERSQLLKELPPAWPQKLGPRLRATLRARRETLLVLDDDATGTQTVHGVPVLLTREPNDLRSALNGDYPAVYLLTNSRSLVEAEAANLNHQVIHVIAEVVGRNFSALRIVSRSDSTLRGHFPAETDAISAEVLLQFGISFDGVLLVPFFAEGGRFTVDDTHWVTTEADAIPAGDTEFARDPVFGFHSSSLLLWVEEKSKGRISSEAVQAVTLEDIRLGGPRRVTEKLLHVAGGVPVVVNATSYVDLEVVVAGLLEAEAAGKKFLYRTAASFVPVRAGIPPRSLLTPEEMVVSGEGKGGLVVVGSFVHRTSTQLASLLNLPGVVGISVNVPALLHSSNVRETMRVAAAATSVLRDGDIAVIYTSRSFVDAGSAMEQQNVSQAVSQGLVTIVRSISERPRYVIAKGGITSSDIATKALSAHSALVLGQVLPGVPVWRLGPESLYPGVPYVVFPGNVGGPEAMADVITLLRGTSQAAQEAEGRERPSS